MPPKSKKQDNKQKNIASFFTKPGKRNSDNKNNDDTPSSKKTKTNLDNSPPLSPEQRKKIEEKKKEALEKLEHNAQQGIDMGHSWKVALQSEFTKPYFQKVSDYNLRFNLKSFTGTALQNGKRKNYKFLLFYLASRFFNCRKKKSYYISPW